VNGMSDDWTWGLTILIDTGSDRPSVRAWTRAALVFEDARQQAARELRKLADELEGGINVLATRNTHRPC
jgi:hypothetical protein